MEGTSQDASREVYASLEDGVPVEGPPNADVLVGDASSEIVVKSLFVARVANAGPSRPRLPNWLMIGSYVPPQDWDCPLANMVTSGPEATWEIINCWCPFNKNEYSIAYMRDLYPTLLQVPVVARAEEYFIPFPSYLDRKSFQRVAEDGMLIHNHNFNESTELVCFNF